MEYTLYLAAFLALCALLHRIGQRALRAYRRRRAAALALERAFYRRNARDAAMRDEPATLCRRLRKAG